MISLLALSGCLPSGFESATQSSVTTGENEAEEIINPGTVAEGVKLYSTNCASCHGNEIEKSQKFGLTKERLTWSLKPGNVPAMQNITLTATEINSLVLALNYSPGNITPVTTERSSRLMARRYMVSVLKEVFQAEGFKDTTFHRHIAPVETSPIIFGTGCNIYSTFSGGDCGGATLNNTGAPFFADSTTVRQLDQLQVCEKLTSESLTFNSAVKNAGGLSADLKVIALTPAHVNNIISLFYPDREIGAQKRTILMNFQSQLTSSKQTVTTQWRLMLQLICEQPEWTVN